MLFDDRAASPGSRFADAELIGMPARVTVGKRTATDGTADVQVRRGRDQSTLAVADVPAAVRAAVDAAALVRAAAALQGERAERLRQR